MDQATASLQNGANLVTSAELMLDSVMELADTGHVVCTNELHPSHHRVLRGLLDASAPPRDKEHRLPWSRSSRGGADAPLARELVNADDVARVSEFHDAVQHQLRRGQSFVSLWREAVGWPMPAFQVATFSSMPEVAGRQRCQASIAACGLARNFTSISNYTSTKSNSPKSETNNYYAIHNIIIPATSTSTTSTTRLSKALANVAMHIYTTRSTACNHGHGLCVYVCGHVLLHMHLPCVGVCLPQ